MALLPPSHFDYNPFQLSSQVGDLITGNTFYGPPPSNNPYDGMIWVPEPGAGSWSGGGDAGQTYEPDFSKGSWQQQPNQYTTGGDSGSSFEWLSSQHPMTQEEFDAISNMPGPTQDNGDVGMPFVHYVPSDAFRSEYSDITNNWDESRGNYQIYSRDPATGAYIIRVKGFDEEDQARQQDGSMPSGHNATFYQITPDADGSGGYTTTKLGTTEWRTNQSFWTQAREGIIGTALVLGAAYAYPYLSGLSTAEAGTTGAMMTDAEMGAGVLGTDIAPAGSGYVGAGSAGGVGAGEAGTVGAGGLGGGTMGSGGTGLGDFLPLTGGDMPLVTEGTALFPTTGVTDIAGTSLTNAEIAGLLGTTGSTSLTAKQWVDLAKAGVQVYGMVSGSGTGTGSSSNGGGGTGDGSGAAASTSNYADLMGQIAKEQWERYKTIYGPLESQYVATAQNYDSPENFSMAAGQAAATVQSQFANARSQLARIPGMDPSSGAYQAGMTGLGLSEAANSAVQQNAARKTVDDTAWSRQTQALSLGKGLPAEATSGANAAANTALNAAKYQTSLDQYNANLDAINAANQGRLLNSAVSAGAGLLGSYLSGGSGSSEGLYSQFENLY